MAATVACFHCSVVAVLEQGSKTIEYDYGDWGRKCAFPVVDGLTACPNMRSALRRLSGCQAGQPFGPLVAPRLPEAPEH
jgi:hypothetical protein